MADLTQMSDDELMSAWTEKAQQAETLKDECREFSAEYQKRLAAAEEERQANKVPSELDQVVGSVE